MAVKKIAISVPEDVIEQVDRAAAERRMTRSAYISWVLRRTARARSDAEITARINAFFSDPALDDEQRETAKALGRLRASEGTEW